MSDEDDEPFVEFDRLELWDDLKKLRDSNRFEEFMIFVWGAIDQEVDWAVDVAFGVPPEKWVEYLVQRSFQGKIDFLRNIDFLAPDEFRHLGKFSQIRNDLFHGSGHLYSLIPGLTNSSIEAEKTSAMNQGIRALDAIEKCLHRNYDEPFSKGEKVGWLGRAD